MENEEVMLTTYDNPFNPFDEFDAWWKEDLRLGHDCCGTLASIVILNDVASDTMNEEEVSRAIDDLIALEPTIYKKVYRTQGTTN